ncbi:MAG: zinc ABC transporter substrate-binding protein [Planctomycetes bacterium]|nr:zinc ABC transporter substrate-binding protein [Planctomycetota bacterium]
MKLSRLFCLASPLLLAYCLFALPLLAEEKPVVISTIPPLNSLTAAVAGDAVRCISLLPPGKSPHDYALSPLDLANLSQARAWFTIGLPLEKPLRERLAARPQLRIVDAAAGIARIPMAGDADDKHDDKHDDKDDGHDEHEHHDAHDGHDAHDQHDEHEGHHAHHHHHHGDDGMDPHLWLDPVRARALVKNVAAGLSEICPERAAAFRANAAKLDQELAALDQGLAAALAPLKGKKIIVYHPAFGYFCARYGLTQLPIELDGRAPSAAWMAKVISVAKRENIKTLFVQPQFNAGSARNAAAAIGGKVVEFDPLPADYLGYLRSLPARLTGANL